MNDQQQKCGSVAVVESTGFVELWRLPLNVSSETRRYVRGMSHDWRSSKILQLPRETDEEFLREV
jgi:hypothetical protein